MKFSSAREKLKKKIRKIRRETHPNLKERVSFERSPDFWAGKRWFRFRKQLGEQIKFSRQTIVGEQMF